MATTSLEQQVDALKSDLQTLRSDLEKLTGQLGNTARAGASEASASVRSEAARLRAELDRLLDIAGEQGQSSMAEVQRRAQEHPLATLAGAFGIGFLIGRLLDRR